MRKNRIAKNEKINDMWNQNYALIIPCFFMVFLAIINYIQRFSIINMCKNRSFDNMLTATITSMSIVISIFGFLMPALISAKEEKMIKYFIENADMKFFIKKIKSVIKAGVIGILLSIVLYLNEELLPEVLKVLLYAWIGVGLNFVCNSYRFISIILGLLLLEKGDEAGRKCVNTLSNDKVQELNSKLDKF